MGNKNIQLSKDYPEDNICRSLYIRLAHDTRKYGLDNEKIKYSRISLSDNLQIRGNPQMSDYPEPDMCKTTKTMCHEPETCKQTGTVFLKPVAYKPTGIALGSPLPDKNIESRLYRLSLHINIYLKSILDSQEPAFALVPPDSYHITLVNWSHYTVSGSMTTIKKEETEIIYHRISGELYNPQIILLNGLILTRTGAVLVPGFPGSQLFYHLRSRLYSIVHHFETYPSPPPPLPCAAHIKLGHLICPLDKVKLQKLSRWLSIWGNHISGVLYFHDMYTRAGRIPLSQHQDTMNNLP